MSLPTFTHLTSEQLSWHDGPDPSDPDGLTPAYQYYVACDPLLFLHASCEHQFCGYVRDWIQLVYSHHIYSDSDSAASNYGYSEVEDTSNDSESAIAEYGDSDVEDTDSDAGLYSMPASAAGMASDRAAWRVSPCVEHTTETEQGPRNFSKHSWPCLMKGSEPLPKTNENGLTWAVFTPIGIQFGTLVEKGTITSAYGFPDREKFYRTPNLIIKPAETEAIDATEDSPHPYGVHYEYAKRNGIPCLQTVPNPPPAPSASLAPSASPAMPALPAMPAPPSPSTSTSDVLGRQDSALPRTVASKDVQKNSCWSMESTQEAERDD